MEINHETKQIFVSFDEFSKAIDENGKIHIDGVPNDSTYEFCVKPKI